MEERRRTETMKVLAANAAKRQSTNAAVLEEKAAPVPWFKRSASTVVQTNMQQHAESQHQKRQQDAMEAESKAQPTLLHRCNPHQWLILQPWSGRQMGQENCDNEPKAPCWLVVVL